MSDKFRYTAGLNNVGSYQVSGKTFITASTVNDGEEDQIQFPDVTNNIKVKLDSAGGVTKNGYVINGSFRLQESTNDFIHRADETYVIWVKRVNPDSGGTQYLLRVQNKITQLLFNSAANTLTIQHFMSDNSFRQAGTSVDFLSMTHLVYAIDHDDSAKLYINGSLEVTVDLPDASLTASDVTEAYNGGNYLDLNSHSKSGDLEHYWLFGDDAGDSFSGVGGSLSVTVNDTIGNSDLSEDGNAGGADTVDAFTHTFGGGGGELRIHYRSKDYNNVISQKHYWTLDSQYESIKMNVKSKELYLSADGGNCDYSISAELTNIPTSSMFQHTGSGVDE